MRRIAMACFVRQPAQGRSPTAASLCALLIGLANASHGATTPPDDIRVVRDAALDARRHCQHYMHEDSIEFLRCVDGLLLAVPATHRASALRRLGVTYFGWLAATAALKNGLPTAADTAFHYLHLLRAAQRPLGIGDDALCPVLPGDCAARNARLKLMDGQIEEDHGD